MVNKGANIGHSGVNGDKVVVQVKPGMNSKTEPFYTNYQLFITKMLLSYIGIFNSLIGIMNFRVRNFIFLSEDN